MTYYRYEHELDEKEQLVLTLQESLEQTQQAKVQLQGLALEEKHEMEQQSAKLKTRAENAEVSETTNSDLKTCTKMPGHNAKGRSSRNKVRC